MTFFQAALLGVVEGVTEFLPISSTAHLILASAALRITQTDFQKSFEIAIQLGAILSIVVLYWREMRLRRDVWLRVLAAFVPTGIIGFAAHSLAKRYLLGNVAVVLWALFLGGILLILFERFHEERTNGSDDLSAITYRQAALIGVFQAVAIIPGVSRAAATIIGGLLLGIRRKTIVDFSFLLAVPTMAAATFLDLWKSAWSFTPGEFGLLGAGFLVSFVCALATVVWFLRFIKHHTFTAFGVYRIALVLIFLLLPA